EAAPCPLLVIPDPGACAVGKCCTITRTIAIDYCRAARCFHL
ncbi:hypothetical protein, partial [Pseudomonas fluorescens]